jgi:hypothetical protein
LSFTQGLSRGSNSWLLVYKARSIPTSPQNEDKQCNRIQLIFPLWDYRVQFYNRMHFAKWGNNTCWLAEFQTQHTILQRLNHLPVAHQNLPGGWNPIARTLFVDGIKESVHLTCLLCQYKSTSLHFCYNLHLLSRWLLQIWT